MIGTTISHYRIIEKLGEGGMGVVYKAEDIKLRRTVALKFLPRQALLTDADRARFVREAEAAASLSHPSIAMIYEFDEVDDPLTGSKSAFIAMEFVEGQTLKDKISERPLPVQAAVNIATAVAEGLQEAHEKGIIHRDIKSANIMVTPKGQVKIMDFGLAEMAGRTKVTKEGTTLGTVAYMSPEQALGEKVDHRTDIWSFGVVLYEMITGKIPFPGDYEQAVVYQILNQEPEPITSLRSNVPMELERIVRKAMQKDRSNRYQHIDEMLVDLKLVRQESTSQISREAIRVEREGRTGVRSFEELKPSPRFSKERLLWLSVTLLLLLSAAAMTFLYLKREPTGERTIRATIPPPPNYSFSYAAGGQTALSPDGRKLAFVTSEFGIQQLWIQSLDATTAQPLAGTQDAFLPFWSPDSRVIGFFSGSKLKRIEASGGTPQTICDAPQPRGGTWSNEDVIVFALNTTGLLYRVHAAGGTPTPITVLDTARRELTQRWPYFLPDGQHFLYFGYRLPGAKGNAINVGSLTTGSKKTLFRAHSNLAYANGYLLFLQGTTLMAQPFDTKALEVKGDAIPLAEDVHFEVGIGRGDFSISQNGVLVCRAGDPFVPDQLLLVDRTGKPVRSLTPSAAPSSPQVSPDGERIALDMFDLRSGNRDIWIYEVGHESFRRVTFDSSAEVSPIWSPDGRKIVYQSDRNGFHDLFMQDLTASRAEELLLTSPVDKHATDWSSDGSFLIYTTFEGARRARDIWILPFTGDRKPKVWLHTEFDEWDAHLSPDTRWIAYTSNESGKYEVYVQEFPGPGAKWQVSNDGGEFPRWAGDGKELFFLSSARLMVADMKSFGPKLRPSEPRTLFSTSQWEGAFFRDVFPDGQKVLLTTSRMKRTPTPMTLILNWPDAIKKK